MDIPKAQLEKEKELISFTYQQKFITLVASLFAITACIIFILFIVSEFFF